MTPASIVLPSGSGGQPSHPRHYSRDIAGIRELSTSGVHSTHVAIRLVGSCPTFSPLPFNEERRLFSSPLLNPHGLLAVNKWDALCCPDFPLSPRGQRQTVRLLSACKDTNNICHNYTILGRTLLISSQPVYHSAHQTDDDRQG